MVKGSALGSWPVAVWVRAIWLAFLVGMTYLGIGAWRQEGENPWVALLCCAVALLPCVEAWRARVTLYDDRVRYRGLVRTIEIPLAQLISVESGGRAGGSAIRWGDGKFTGTRVDLFAGADRRRGTGTRARLITRTRDQYLAREGLTALEHPFDVAARDRAELREKGWVEKYNL